MADNSNDEGTTTTTKKTAAVHWQEVQDTVSRLASHKGVLGVSILNPQGSIVTHQTTSGAANNGNAGSGVLGNPRLLTKLMKDANDYVRSISGHEANETNNDESTATTTNTEDISFLRIRTQKDEILVAPKLGYTLVVLQDPSVSAL